MDMLRQEYIDEMQTARRIRYAMLLGAVFLLCIAAVIAATWLAPAHAQTPPPATSLSLNGTLTVTMAGTTPTSSSVVVSTTAADPIGVTTITISLDGNTIATCANAATTANCGNVASWKAGTGQHTITATALTKSGVTPVAEMIYAQ